MLISIVRQIVGLCSRYAWAVVAAATIISAGSGYYAATHFAITTDINKLISPTLDWRQRELAYEKEFPGSYGSILVVVDAPSPELATEASAKLAQELAERPDLFHVGAPARRRSVLCEKRPAVSTGERSCAHGARARPGRAR